MAAKYWIKLYHEILDDLKMGPLSPELWRFTIELFLLAGETDCNGTLPNVTKISWRLRYTVTQVETWLKQLADETGIVEQTEAGWIVANFAERQAASGVNERVKRHRERQKAQQNVTSDVTKSETKVKRNVTPEADTDTDINSSSSSAEVEKKLTKFYLNCKEAKPDLAADYINEFLETYPPGNIDYALAEAVKNNAYSLAYIESVCKRLKTGQPKPKGHRNGKYQPGDQPSTDPDRIPSVNIYDD